MNEWISVKEQIPDKDKIVWLTHEKNKDKESSKERVFFQQGQWFYPSGLKAYELTKTDVWRALDE